MKIAKSFTFESAHFIAGHPRCGTTHGHTWTLTVFLTGSKLNSNGMIMDFSELGTVVKYIISKIDHKCINEVLKDDIMFRDAAHPITAETLVCWFVWQIRHAMSNVGIAEDVSLGCRLQEGPGGWAEYWEGEELTYG